MSKAFSFGAVVCWHPDSNLLDGRAVLRQMWRSLYQMFDPISWTGKIHLDISLTLWDPLRTRAIPERLRGVITTRRYTNPRLPLPLPFSHASANFHIHLWELVRIILPTMPIKRAGKHVKLVYDVALWVCEAENDIGRRAASNCNAS